jgi:hypothetical protein
MTPFLQPFRAESLGRGVRCSIAQRYDAALMAGDEHLDPQQRFAEKERAHRADEEALRSGQKTEAQLQRQNNFFPFPADRIRINLDSARSLS